jgi:hypothetical protein
MASISTVRAPPSSYNWLVSGGGSAANYTDIPLSPYKPPRYSDEEAGLKSPGLAPPVAHGKWLSVPFRKG